MNYRIEQIKISTIYPDDRFKLNSTTNYNSIKTSIESIGLLYPLIGWKHNHSILLVDGFKRLQVAHELDLTELPFIILADDHSFLDLINVRFYNLKQSDFELNVLQKLSLYNLVLDSSTDINLHQKWRSILNLSNPEKQLHILNWPKVAKEYIQNYNISLKQIRSISDHSNQIIKKIFTIAQSLSIRIIELSKIMELISEIALNEHISIISILEGKEIGNLINSENLNRNQKILKLKQYLYERRYPIISAYQKKLNEQLKKLSFSNNVQINYDKYFENPEILLNVKLKNDSDLDQFTLSISNMTNISTLKNVLKIL